MFFWRIKLKDGSSNLKIFFITGKEENLFIKSKYINSEILIRLLLFLNRIKFL